jgi:heavy metal sensor kinase
MPFVQPDSFFRTLRMRLTLWSTAVLLALVVLALWGVREGLRWTMLRELDQILSEDLAEITHRLARPGVDVAELREDLTNKAESHALHRWFVQLYDTKGGLLWASANAPELPPPEPLAAGRLRHVERPPYRVCTGPSVGPNRPTRLIRVGCSLEMLQEDVELMTRMTLLVGGIILVLAPLAGYWLAGRATRPLNQIIATTASLRPDNPGDRLPLRRTGDELDQLSATINGLLDRIAADLAQSRDFVANAAHELRSPLTAIQSSVEIALNQERTPEEYVELLGEVSEVSNHLRVLVNQLLLLAESDTGPLNLKKDVVRLDHVIEKAVSMFQGVAESEQIELLALRLTAVTVLGNESHLRQVVNNLLDNAIKFNRPGGQVRIELLADAHHGQATLRVWDTGRGIAPEDLPHVFDRFYRVDKSRQRQTHARSTGLGLSICESIVGAHLGTISAESTPGQGSCFTVVLPLYVPPAA